MYYITWWCQNILLFDQNNFVFNKKYCYHIIYYIITIYIYFFSFKLNIFCCIKWIFHSITFLVIISGLPFVFTKIRNLHSVCKLNSSTRVQKSYKGEYYPVDIYLLKVNNTNTRTRCEMYSKLAIKTPERRQWPRSYIFIVNFISHLFLVFLLLILNM